MRESYPAEYYSVGERGPGRDFSVGEPRPAPPRGLPGTIRDWFDKASNISVSVNDKTLPTKMLFKV